MKAALEGRVGMAVPSIDKAAYARARTIAIRIANHLRRTHGPQQPWTCEQVVSNFHGAKRQRYENARVQLLEGGVVRSTLTTFVKVETTAYKLNKPFPTPRPITFRDYKFGLQLAQYIKPIEHVTYQLVGAPGTGWYPCIAKNLNSEARAELLWKKWNRFKNPHAYMFDAHRYDAHVQEPLLRLKHLVYTRLIDDPHFRNLLEKQLRAKGYANYDFDKVKYSVRGCTCSGDMDTACGNCIIMIVLLVYCLEQAGKKQYEIVVDGDDSTVICEGELNVAAVEAAAAELGFVMPLDNYASSFEQIDFCQCHPVCVDGKWKMVRDYKRAISKSLTNVKFADYRGIPKRLRTIAQGELSLCVGVPILQEYFSRLEKISRMRMSDSSLKRRGGFDVSILGDYRLTRELGVDWQLATAAPISSETRLSFSRAFGIAADEQVRLEAIIGGWTLPESLRPSEAEGVDGWWHLPAIDSTLPHMGF